MRVFLGGRDVPRDEFALIGIGESTGVPVVLLLEDGEVFTPEDYMSLGYTNFEAWCVGAVGGRGGDAGNAVIWRVSKTTEILPDDLWADVVAEYNSINGPSYHYTGISSPGTPEPPVGVVSWGVISGGYISWTLTPEGLAWLQNPTHEATIINWLEPIIQPGLGDIPQPGPKYIGGGGGGGGLHVVKGFLADLPTSVIAEIGQPGADGAPGQLHQAAPWDPSPVYDPISRMSLARWNFVNRFPNGHPTVDAPAEGSPGGASSFGDICQASGGKGGKPAIQWAGSTLQQYAHGGQGGIGGSDVSGGGADGAITSTSTGKDGGWNGIVGSGGGGGRGGVKFGTTTDPDISATAGGRGSLNFGDTSVYGARGPLGTYFAAIRNYTREVSVYLGELISIIDTLIPANINPGSGGGARIPGNRKYGSRAQGYSHGGAVLLRLTKID